MNEAIARWLEQKRRRSRVLAAVMSVLALGAGAMVFLLSALLVFAVLSVVSGAWVRSGFWPGLAALGVTAWWYARIMKSKQHGMDLYLDPTGLWIFEDICAFGPRLILEGLRQVRYWAELGEMNVAACARALTYLARQKRAVTWEALVRYCPNVSCEHLRAQLLLLDGVLFLGEDASRVTLMEPFRLRLRSILGHEQSEADREPDRPRPQSDPGTPPVNDPEKLTAYELLGLSPLASLVEIKTAYRKRLKTCHPDLFAGMDLEAKALAERWTKALNAAYATLNPRQRGARRPGV